MSGAAGFEDTSHMKTFETKMRAMDPDKREAYIDAYLSWLHDEVGGLGKQDSRTKTNLLTEAFQVFVLGKSSPDPELVKRLQEIFTIGFYLIGDASWDEPNVRLTRAMQRRVKLLNIWRAAMGLEDLSPGEIPSPGDLSEDYIKARLNFLTNQIILLEDALAKIEGKPAEEKTGTVIKVDD